MANRNRRQLPDEYRATLYKNYAESFKNKSGTFDYDAAVQWESCFVWYLRNWLPVDKEARIVDLGCGEGRIVYLLQRMGYKNVFGVDISESQLRIARQVSDQLTTADVLDYLESTSDKFDVILSFDVVEHLNKSEALTFFDLCFERLSDGGRLVLQTPNASSPFFGDVRYGDFTHEIAFTPKLLSQLVLRSGFKDAECRETGPVPVGYSWKSSLRSLAWWFVRIVYCALESIETGSCGFRIYTRVFLISAVRRNISNDK